jgi:hypothetical protein
MITMHASYARQFRSLSRCAFTVHHMVGQINNQEQKGTTSTAKSACTHSQQITLPLPTPIHVAGVPCTTTRNHTGNCLLHVRPLRFSREGHIPNIINIQLAIAPTKCRTPALFAIPLYLVDCLETSADSRRYHWNL